MKKTILAGVFVGVLMAFGVAESTTYSPGITVSVRALKARIMSSPQFLGASVVTVRRGARVKVLAAKGSWVKVSYRGRVGWVHQNRITKKVIKISSGNTSSGTTRGEAELAGRGFSPKTEQDFKQKNPKMDYSHVDNMQSLDVDPSSVARFKSDGKVAGPSSKKGGGQ